MRKGIEGARRLSDKAVEVADKMMFTDQKLKFQGQEAPEMTKFGLIMCQMLNSKVFVPFDMVMKHFAEKADPDVFKDETPKQKYGRFLEVNMGFKQGS